MNTQPSRRDLLRGFVTGIAIGLFNSGAALAKKKGDKNYPLVRKTIPLPGHPEAIALSSDGTHLAVIQDSGLSLVDLRSQALAKTFAASSTGILPDVFFTGDGSLLYFTNQDSQIDRIELGRDSTSPQAWISVKPDGQINGLISGLALSPNQRFLAAGVSQADKVVLYELAKRIEVLSFSGLKAPYGVIFSRDGRELVVGQQCQQAKAVKPVGSPPNNEQKPCMDKFGFISSIDLEHRTLKAQIEVGGHTGRLCMNKDGSRLFVASSDGLLITSINLATMEVSERISIEPVRKGQTPSAPVVLCLDLDGKRLYAGLTDLPWIAVISLGSQSSKSLIEEPSKVEGLIPVPGKPRAIGLNLEGTRFLVALNEPVEWSEPKPTAGQSPGAVAIIEMPTAKQWSSWLGSYLKSHS